MEPTTPSPPTPTPALPFLLLSKIALDASRTEILVLASGVLFLASQVCLLVWVLRRTTGGYAAPREKEHRKVAIVLPAGADPLSRATADAHDDFAVSTNSDSNGKDESTLRVRRVSSWGGRPAHFGSHGPQGRRKSAGLLGKRQDSDDDGDDGEEGQTGAQTSLSSPGPEPPASRGALTALGDMGRMAAELATPAMLPLPRLGGGQGVEDAEDTELREFGAPRAWGGLDILAAASSIEKPRSPRSPRVLAADQAAMMDALYTEGDWKADASPPAVGAEVDAPALAFGFEDPLGVNRLVDLPGKEEEGHEAVELEARDGGRRDVGV